MNLQELTKAKDEGKRISIVCAGWCLVRDKEVNLD